jgi:hypothetical protein
MPLRKIGPLVDNAVFIRCVLLYFVLIATCLFAGSDGDCGDLHDDGVSRGSFVM